MLDVDLYTEKMSLTKKERIMAERAKSRGYEFSESQNGMPFVFRVSPVITSGVDVSVFFMLAQRIIAKIMEKEFRCDLNGVVVFPRILDPKVKKADELSSFRRRDKAFYVGLGIDFGQWVNGSTTEKMGLALHNIVDSVRLIPICNLPQSSRDTLIDIIFEAFRAAGND